MYCSTGGFKSRSAFEGGGGGGGDGSGDGPPVVADGSTETVTTDGVPGEGVTGTGVLVTSPPPLAVSTKGSGGKFDMPKLPSGFEIVVPRVRPAESMATI